MGNAYALCMLAGLWEGECLGRSWDQVDFKGWRIIVSQQLQKEKCKGAKYYISTSIKNGESREIRTPDIAFQYLKAEKSVKHEISLQLVPCGTMNTTLFLLIN